MAALPKVCVIGAGSSGITTAKALIERGIPFDCFEKSDRLGGNWVFGNANGQSSAYRSLHINTSRDKMCFSDFPMPADYPDYPHHSQIAAYFDAYAAHFGVTQHVTFNMAVTWAERKDDGTWLVTLENGEKRLYDALIVCNGHHWDPRWPEPAVPGTFDGTQIHSHNYIDPADPVDCAGKNVVVVGFGNSALDIACELGRKGVAENLYLSMRRGYWVMPKYFGSQVLDALTPHPSKDPPWYMRLLGTAGLRAIVRRRVTQAVGRPQDYGLPAPDHDILETHPAVSQEIYIRIGSGDVKPVADIRELKGDRVLLADGREIPADVIVWCTGYKITFPFLDHSIIAAPDNDIALWKRIIDPRYPNLFFIGLVQTLCAIMPVAEQQAIFIADYLAGLYLPPPASLQDRERLAVHEGEKKGWVRTARHTIQINCGAYTHDLRRELRAGRKRATAAGLPLTVPPIAANAARVIEAAE